MGGVALNQGGNSVATLATFNAGGGAFTLRDGAPLSQTGNLTAGTATLLAPSLQFGGSVTAGGLDLEAGGTIIRTASAGAFNVGMLTGAAITLAQFGSGTGIDAIGNFTVLGGTLAIDNAVPLVVGQISANSIGITAAGRITLGGDIVTTGLPIAVQAASTSPVDPGSYFSVTGAGASIQQTGTVQIRPTPGASIATVRLNLPESGGTITFNNLVAPRTDLILFTNSTGKASGTINVNNLKISGVQGAASLFGSVNNIGGPEAARLATIGPRPASQYRLNGCPIASVNCILLPIGTLPAANPLRDFSLDANTNNGNDDDLALPDVSSTDY